MKHLSHSENSRALLIAVAMLCLTLLPKVQAVVPAPDGGYPGANTAEGQSALFSLTTGTYNTAVGILALRSDTTGSYNTCVGAGALLANTGDQNTATGFGALLSNTTGVENTANGASALFNNITGSFNIAVGQQALLRNTTGSTNTAIGRFALGNNTAGFVNIALGFSAGENVTTASNVICIGASGNNVDNSCYIGNIFDATSSNGIAVFVNSNGRLGTATSSSRFKEDIKPMGKASESLLALKPVMFRYKKGIDPENLESKPEFGLVAEDVEKVNHDLVVSDKEGRPYSVRYDQVNAMLLNEFLKEHRKVGKLEATLEQQQKSFESRFAEQEREIRALTSDIHKINAQFAAMDPPRGLTISEPALQVALANQ